MHFESSLDAALALMKEIMLDKRRMRGTKNITEQGLRGVLTRLSKDKLKRVEHYVDDLDMRDNLRKRGISEPKIIEMLGLPLSEGEPVYDDLIDIANYAVIMYLLVNNQWE